VNAFFSQNAGKGVRLFELLSKRYDVVAANPPYMCRGTQQDLIYVKDQFDFKFLDGAPIVYWWPDSVIQLFLDHPKFADFAACKDGTGTRNNSRFIRFHWEANNNSRWVKHQKGDGYNRWQGGNHFLIDLEYDAARILSTGKSRHQNTAYFFKIGCVWTKVGQLSISSRFIDGSTVFDDATPGCFPPDPNDAYVAVGLLNSSTISPKHERRCLSPDDLATLKVNLRTLYEAGPGAKVDIEDNNTR
jgi:hypothetical protein